MLLFVFFVIFFQRNSFNPHTLVSSSGLGGRVMEACVDINTKPVKQTSIAVSLRTHSLLC